MVDKNGLTVRDLGRARYNKYNIYEVNFNNKNYRLKYSWDRWYIYDANILHFYYGNRTKIGSAETIEKAKAWILNNFGGK